MALIRDEEKIKEMSEAFDWKEIKKYPPMECHCSCGAVFHSYTKLKGIDVNFYQLLETPCPSCGMRTKLTKTSSGDPEPMSFGKDDVSNI